MNIDQSSGNTSSLDKVKVILCFSGSVATVKIPELCLSLLDSGNIELILVGSGDAAYHFLNRSQYYNPKYWRMFVERKCEEFIVYDSDEWNMWDSMGDLVLHIELRKWADVLLLAPASADIIAKISHGVSDSLLLSIVRAWDFDKPCVICPAMNTLMWTHPATQQSLDILANWGWDIVNPVVKTLACNERGSGALAAIQDIVDVVIIKASTIPKSEPYSAINLLREIRKRRNSVPSDSFGIDRTIKWNLVLSVMIPCVMYILAVSR